MTNYLSHIETNSNYMQMMYEAAKSLTENSDDLANHPIDQCLKNFTEIFHKVIYQNLDGSTAIRKLLSVSHYNVINKTMGLLNECVQLIRNEQNSKINNVKDFDPTLYSISCKLITPNCCLNLTVYITAEMKVSDILKNIKEQYKSLTNRDLDEKFKKNHVIVQSSSKILNIKQPISKQINLHENSVKLCILLMK